MEKTKQIGLTTQQAIRNKAKGSNELTQRETESFLDMLKDSLNDTWLKILMVALALEVLFYAIGRIWSDMGSDDWFSAVAIFVVIVAVSVNRTGSGLEPLYNPDGTLQLYTK